MTDDESKMLDTLRIYSIENDTELKKLLGYVELIVNTYNDLGESTTLLSQVEELSDWWILED